MDFRRKTRLLTAGIMVGLLGLVTVAPAGASHAWNGYHWARTSNPFTVKLGDNVAGVWDTILATTAADWSISTVLDTTVVAGGTNNKTGQRTPKNCRPTGGQVEVCSAKYGNNGWLGVASVWVSGQHITQGAVKLNDTYFNASPYNTTPWRNLVSCQEVGHTLGLDHQDEVFGNGNLGSCMDYTNDPSTNQHPNQHDYDQLALIYGHLDATTTLSARLSPSANAQLGGQDDWGQAIRFSRDGRPSLYVRDLGNGEKVFTWVIWADRR